MGSNEITSSNWMRRDENRLTHFGHFSKRRNYSHKPGRTAQAGEKSCVAFNLIN